VPIQFLAAAAFAPKRVGGGATGGSGVLNFFS